MQIRWALTFAVAVVAPLSGGHAQVAPIDGWGWSILIPSVSQTDILGTQLRDQRARDAQRSSSTPSAPATAKVQPNPAALRFAPSRARREVNFASFLAQSKSRDPAGARSLEEIFSGGDVIERILPVLAAYGLRVDNVADAYTTWWINAWLVSHRRSDTPDKAVFAAVRAQAAAALSSTPELTSANDAAKQKFAEALLVQSVLLDAAMEQSKGDPARLGPLADAAAQGGRGMGLDLTSMDLTPTGFVTARR